MSLLIRIFLLFVAVLIVVFAIANRAPVTVDFWPMPIEFRMPLSFVILATLLVGVVAGGVATWWSAGRTRQRARDEHRQAESLAREIRRLEAEAAEQKRAPPALPAQRVAVLNDD